MSVSLSVFLVLASVQVAPQQATGAPVAATADRATALAAVVLPADALVATRLPRFETMFAAEIATDANLDAIDKTHPGLKQAVMRAGREEARIAYARAVSLLQADAARLYQSRFTPAEIATLTKFFSSPTGKALVTLSAEASGDTASAFEADRRRRVTALLQEPSDQAKADLSALIASGLMPKMQALKADVSALSERRFGDVDAIVSGVLPARIAATIKAHTKGAN